VKGVRRSCQEVLCSLTPVCEAKVGLRTHSRTSLNVRRPNSSQWIDLVLETGLASGLCITPCCFIN